MTGPQLLPGAVVPPLRRAFPLDRMVAYAGATWDWHRLHYDTEYVAARGLPAPVVDGQVLGALLAEQLQRWLGPQCVLRTLHFRFAQPVFAGESVVCTGRVTTVGDDGLVTVEQRVEVTGPKPRTAVSTAGATLTLTPPPPGPDAGGPE
ncbi:MaoC/PaaZ C-terminal domain-containing protein [Streptomyces sp. NPDC059818]|uniref:MaoC/PaaZ C-terminal domain-containing protein n=1 Tax=Streptomyces sp. NPDC059818 TaxID=3346962 RepID=UPI003652E94F